MTQYDHARSRLLEEKRRKRVELAKIFLKYSDPKLTKKEKKELRDREVQIITRLANIQKSLAKES